MPSATTMALSTIMPSAMTSAPRDMRCRSMPNIAIRMKVPRIVTISAVPMITPMRQPMARVSTTSTMADGLARG